MIENTTAISNLHSSATFALLLAHRGTSVPTKILQQPIRLFTKLDSSIWATGEHMLRIALDAISCQIRFVLVIIDSDSLSKTLSQNAFYDYGCVCQVEMSRSRGQKDDEQ